jgi:glycosyltransferase involved in cell wall biosynthesis
MFLGRMTHDMGLDTVLEAIPSLRALEPGAFIVLVGADGGLRMKASEVAEASAGYVRLVIDASDESLPGLVAAADLVMLPTAGGRACGSLAAIEAMASGRPVVTTRVGGIPEIVDGHCAVLVDPGDPSSLSAVVVDLLRDADRRSAMGLNGQRRARELFDRDVTNAALESYFLNAVASAPGRSTPVWSHAD